MKQFAKKYSFFFHYNKPASLAAGCNKLTVHWRGACHLVDAVVCNVPIHSVDRARQPRCVLKGIVLDLAFSEKFDKAGKLAKTTAFIS